MCAERIYEVLDTETSVVAPDKAVALTADDRSVEFRAARFQYPGADDPVLRDISFTARPGTTTAIVGSTGSVIDRGAVR